MTLAVTLTPSMVLGGLIVRVVPLMLAYVGIVELLIVTVYDSGSTNEPKS